LNRLPRLVPLVIVLALALLAIFVPGPVGGVALFVVAGFLLWLAYFSWPASTPASRLLRILAVGIVIAAGVVTVGK
jgi:uncharacterized protein involved in cysteine biosynthesis